MLLGYFWPTLRQDAQNLVLGCPSCQIHATEHLQPANFMVPITSPWPFEQWGTDIIGPFPKAVGGYTFLVTAVDYFTKWVGPSHSEPSLGWLYRNSSENASFAASGFLGWSFRTTESSLLTIRSEDGARTSASGNISPRLVTPSKWSSRKFQPNSLARPQNPIAPGWIILGR